jgi:methionine-gamma-lyase
MWAAKPPIFMSSTFAYPSAQYAKDVHEAFFDGTGPMVGTTHHIYSRLGHPGLDFLETRLAAMDGAEAAAAVLPAAWRPIPRLAWPSCARETA